MRDLTDQEKEQYKYSVFFTIDVKRTDGALLTESENAMVQDMRTATEIAIARVMADHGNKTSKNLGTETRVY